MKYKVGDIVKLRDDLENFRNYGEVNAGMINQIKENPFEIVEIVNRKYKNETDWVANDKMIEGLWEECKSSEQVSKPEGKLKLIDVLNKIANGELKEGTKVICNNSTFEYRKLHKDSGRNTLDLYSKNNTTLINATYLTPVLSFEVELIEPQEPTDNTTEKIEELKYVTECTMMENIFFVIDKLNEVIRKLNKENNNE